MVHAYSQKIFSGQKPVFDGRRNLYSRDALPIGREKVIKYSDKKSLESQRMATLDDA